MRKSVDVKSTGGLVESVAFRAMSDLKAHPSEIPINPNISEHARAISWDPNGFVAVSECNQSQSFTSPKEEELASVEFQQQTHFEGASTVHNDIFDAMESSTCAGPLHKPARDFDPEALLFSADADPFHDDWSLC